MFKLVFKILILLVVYLFPVSNLFAAVPAGYYYFAKNTKKAELKTALHTYCAPLYVLDYGSGTGYTWEGFFFTDRNADNSVIDMYSNKVRTFNGYSSINDMHIEHSFPKSWWGGHNNNAYKDLFHLYPADATTNITKSNLPLGEVIVGTSILDNGVSKIGNSGFQLVYTDKCFEPADEFKGDFARSYFYISTIYEDYSTLWASPMMNNTTYPVWKPWALDLLLKWHRQDPVSVKEQARIEAIYNIQGNRNPFIDYPNLVDYIWGADSTKVYPFPQETEAFLLSPRRGKSLDFGVILQNDARTQSLHLQGVNINSNLQLSLKKNNTSFSLSELSVSNSNVSTGIDLLITFSPTTSGLFCDTLLVQGGGLTESLQIPLKALASADFITIEPSNITPCGGKVQWISVPQATDYQLLVYQGDKQAGDLIISAYVEGSSWNKAIEIFNGTGRAIDLANYSIQKQSDGVGPFVSALKLSGTLSNNSTYVIAHKSATSGLLSISQLKTDSVLQFNGNDAISLVRNGFVIDRVGEANAGASIYWGTDVTLKRKPQVTHPLSEFNPNEWSLLPIDSWNMLGNHSMNLLVTADEVVTLNVQTGITTSYIIDNLTPENTYTYKVIANKPNGDLTAVNTSQIHTLPLDKPILMQPTDVQSTKFVANWEDVLHATGYLLNVFSVAGQADTTENEGFDMVGASGKPLPVGWSGTASGNYTGSTSTGISEPSIGLKSNGEWLQTKNYSIPVTDFSFMYKFASTGTGSSLGVYGLNNGNWTKIDSIVYTSTAKFYPRYCFTKNDAITSFRLIYHKSMGNLSVDDMRISYANQDTLFFNRNLPVQTTFARIDGLKENIQYYFNVKATRGNSVSLPSESTSFRTLLTNYISTNHSSTVKFYKYNNGVKLMGLTGSENIQINSITGSRVFRAKATSSELEIPIKQNGIYLIRIQNNQSTFTVKFLK